MALLMAQAFQFRSALTRPCSGTTSGLVRAFIAGRLTSLHGAMLLISAITCPCLSILDASKHSSP